MVPKVGHLKPFLIEEKKEGPKQSISETTANKWQGNIVANIKKNEKWLPYIGKTWGQKPPTVALQGLRLRSWPSRWINCSSRVAIRTQLSLSRYHA